MRGSLFAVVMLVGCSSAETTIVADAGGKTCATTSCVAGASCTTRDGTTCRCFEAGVWTCGEAAEPAPTPDASFTFDSSPTDAGPLSRDIKACGTSSPCAGENPVAAAELELMNLMQKCGAACTQLTLFSAPESGCPVSIVANVAWTADALDCVAAEVGQYFWYCSTSFHASTTGSCPK